MFVIRPKPRRLHRGERTQGVTSGTREAVLAGQNEPRVLNQWMPLRGEMSRSPPGSHSGRYTRLADPEQQWDMSKLIGRQARGPQESLSLTTNRGNMSCRGGFAICRECAGYQPDPSPKPPIREAAVSLA